MLLMAIDFLLACNPGNEEVKVVDAFINSYSGLYFSESLLGGAGLDPHAGLLIEVQAF